MGEKIEILIEGKDGLTHPAQSATRALGGLSSAASTTGHALGGLGRALGGIASQALGFGAAIVGLQALGGITGMIQNTLGGMIGMNAQMETMSQSFKILLSDAAATGGGIVASNEEIGEATRSTASSVTNAQERMADSAEDHQRALEDLAKDFAELETDGTKAMTKLSRSLEETLGEMTERHLGSVLGFRRQLDDYTREFARQADERRATFDREMAARQQRLSEELAGIRKRYAEQAKTAPERFLREREAAVRNAEFLQDSIAEEEAKGKGADQTLLASLRQRLQQEQALQTTTFTQFQAREKAQQRAEEDTATARASREQEILRERFEYERQISAETNAQRIADVQQRMAEEDAEYTKAIAKRRADYEEDLAAFKESEAEKMAALLERQEAEGRQYARTLRDTEQALAQAGATFTKAQQKATQTTGGSVNQMKQMFENLARAVGRPLETAEDRAAAMLEFIKKKAKETPFDIPDIQQMVRRLLAYQLDATQFLDTVGNVAAGMGVPIRQVADAFGALATGQMGESVMRFREFGVNLRSIEGLKFDAQGALVTPIEEALTRVKAAMDTRFGGMMSEQAKTFSGIMSNLRDAWGQFLEVAGKPLFVEVRGALQGLMTFMEANDAKLKEFGATLGASLAGGLKSLGPMAEAAMTGLLEWLQSGRAIEDARSFAATAQDIARFLRDVIRFGGDVVRVVRDTGNLITEIGRSVEGVIVTIDSIGPTIEALGVSLWLDIFAWWDRLMAQVARDIETWKLLWAAFTDALGSAWSGLITDLGSGWQALTEFAKASVNAIIGYVNAMIRAWNSLAFEIPSMEVPFLGRVGGGRIETPDLPEIPVLDTGAIVSRPTLAMLARNNRPEAVVPLDRAGTGIMLVYNQNAPVYGFANFEDSVVAAYEMAQRKGRIG